MNREKYIGLDVAATGARMPTSFHPHAHLHSLDRQIAVELLRFLAVLQSPFL